MSSDTAGSEAPFLGLKTNSQMTNHWQQCFLAHKNTPARKAKRELTSSTASFTAMPALKTESPEDADHNPWCWALQCAWWESLKQHMNLHIKSQCGVRFLPPPRGTVMMHSRSFSGLMGLVGAKGTVPGTCSLATRSVLCILPIHENF